MNKQKEEIFEKIVKWEEKPKIGNIVISIIFCSIFLTFPPNTYWKGIMDGIIITMCLIIIICSMGSGKKVSWRKIK